MHNTHKKVAPRNPLRDRKLQSMVDEHARMGYEDSEIKTHLREQHGVSLTEIIPPPTKAAQRARDKFFETGCARVTVTERADESVFNFVIPSSGLTRQEEEERFQKAINEVSAKYGVTPIVKQELRERNNNWRNNPEVFFSTVYRGTGSTLLDRMIHGFSGVFRKLEFGPGSNFEVFRECLTERMERCAELGVPGESAISADFAEEDNIFKAIDVSLFPWFKSGCVTTNIQIDSDMAEIFLAGKAPASNAWVKEFLEKPVYIDIHEKSNGQRTVSGIFCRPVPALGTFSYMAVVEWIGQGYEAFVFGEYRKSSEALVMCIGEEELHQEAIDALYGNIPEQIEKIAAMSYMYCRTKLDARQSIPALISMPQVCVTSGNDKKERNKEKTHSYFRVMRLEVPADRFGFTGKVGKSWSLDHLVSVTGHFRWQPYGAGNNLRKLIWIDAYEKGQGVRHHPESNPVLLQVPAPPGRTDTTDDDEEHRSCRP